MKKFRLCRQSAQSVKQGCQHGTQWKPYMQYSRVGCFVIGCHRYIWVTINVRLHLRQWMSCIVDDTSQTYQCRQVDPLCDSNCGVWRADCVCVCQSSRVRMDTLYVLMLSWPLPPRRHAHTHTHFFVAHILSRKTQPLYEFDLFCPLSFCIVNNTEEELVFTIQCTLAP